MYKKLGCAACDHGEVYFYFKSDATHLVRTEAYDCHYCNSGVLRLGVPKAGEEPIGEIEFLSLLENGWEMEA
jgi:hypothetical protein